MKKQYTYTYDLHLRGEMTVTAENSTEAEHKLWDEVTKSKREKEKSILLDFDIKDVYPVSE